MAEGEGKEEAEEEEEDLAGRLKRQFVTVKSWLTLVFEFGLLANLYSTTGSWRPVAECK